MLLLNALRSGDEGPFEPSVVDGAARGVVVARLRGTARDEVALQPGEASVYELGPFSEASNNTVLKADFAVDAAGSVSAVELDLRERCPQSLQLLALVGLFGVRGSASAEYTPSLEHIDGGALGCGEVQSPVIPPATTVPATTTQPPLTEKNYDLTGLGSGVFGQLESSSAPRRRPEGHGASLLACAAVAAALLVAAQAQTEARTPGSRSTSTAGGLGQARSGSASHQQQGLKEACRQTAGGDGAARRATSCCAAGRGRAGLRL